MHKKAPYSTLRVIDDDYVYLPNEELLPQFKPLPVTLEQQMKHWDDANEVFFGKERDLENFPHPEFTIDPPTLNFGLVPTAWCKKLYERLGVSGVYTLVWGSVLALMSKEKMFADCHGYELVSRALIFCLVLKNVIPKIRDYLDRSVVEDRVETYEEPMMKAIATCASNIEVAKNAIWRMEAVADIYSAKKEMVDLQLESVYRERLSNVYKQVKEKLDYQVDVIALERSFQQANMVNWIVDSVEKSITPQMEKENIKSCIANLNALAKQS